MLLTNEDQLKTSPGVGVQYFEKNLQGQEGKELFRKTKKSSHKKYILSITFTTLFPGLLRRQKYQMA